MRCMGFNICRKKAPLGFQGWWPSEAPCGFGTLWRFVLGFCWWIGNLSLRQTAHSTDQRWRWPSNRANFYIPQQCYTLYVYHSYAYRAGLPTLTSWTYAGFCSLSTIWQSVGMIWRTQTLKVFVRRVDVSHIFLRFFLAPLPTRSLRGMVGVRGTDEGALLHSYPFGVLWPSWWQRVAIAHEVFFFSFVWYELGAKLFWNQNFGTMLPQIKLGCCP